MYNAETWCLAKNELKYLEKNYHEMARFAMNENRYYSSGEFSTYNKPSTENFLNRHKLQSVCQMIAQRKAVWIAHLERGKDVQFRETLNALRQQRARWWIQCEEDLKKYDVTVKMIHDRAEDALGIRELFVSSRPTVRLTN